MVTFEPLEIYQSYIPFWKAQECGNNAWEAQGQSCMFILRQTSVKMAVLLHKQAKVPFIMIIAVYTSHYNCKTSERTHFHSTDGLGLLGQNSSCEKLYCWYFNKMHRISFRIGCQFKITWDKLSWIWTFNAQTDSSSAQLKKNTCAFY